MPLKFASFCHLLSDLEDVELHNPPYIRPQKEKRLTEIVDQWFRSHRSAVNALSVNGSTALLSSFLPEWRTDRVYGVQASGLCRTIGRLLNLGGSRLNDLQAYKEPGRGDLAECLERVQRSGGVLGRPALLIEEVDAMLQSQASRSRFSDKSIPASTTEERNKLLGNLLIRASPVESKWLVRLLLKDLSPVRIDQDLILKRFHFLLPDLLRFQRDLNAAVSQLKESLSDFPAHPDTRSERDYRIAAAQKLRPQVGVKVGRSEFTKCRGIDHCMKLVQSQRWVLERKYDGEYCEVHIDLTRPRLHWIKIYSKSGKDSTDDRKGLHQTLINCLRLGSKECKIKRQAILLGELVIYSDKDECILPFEKIRKYVQRSAQYIGTDRDSQPYPHEHLAIVFFDLLLWDDDYVMTRSVDQRRALLREIYHKRHGRAMGAEWKVLDFADGASAKKRLIEQFAASNAQRCEGLILKPLGIPYFTLDGGSNTEQQCVKLKKDYINGLGDEADFAVVGASYNAQTALKRGMPDLRWTSFHLACLMNKPDVERFDARPQFRHVATIEDESCIPLSILQTVNSLGPFVADDAAMEDDGQPFDVYIEHGVRIDTFFNRPFVFEVIGSDFVKPSNCNFLMLRHPRVKKLHEDRSWKSCISFQELQAQAVKARAAPVDSESQETRRWVEKLERSCKRKFDREKSASDRHETSSLYTERPLQPSGTEVLQKRPLSTISEPAHAAAVGNVAVNHRAKIQRGTWESASCRTESPDSTSRTAPLSEITNQARVRQDKPIDSNANGKDSAPFIVADLPSRAWPSGIRPPTLSGTTCGGSCLFGAAVVLLAPCIRGYMYVCEDLLPTHDTSVVNDLSHWDRDCFSRAPLSESVSESQAYPGQRKIVLVERRRKMAVLDMIENIRELNGGNMKEQIEVYDWRVLEDCQLHDRGADDLKEHFIGVALFNDTLQQVIFVSEIK